MNLACTVEKLGELGLVWPDSATAHATLGSPFTPETRAKWQRLLRRAYGQSTLLVGHAIFGRALELAHLPALQSHTSEWTKRVAECPSLAPLLVPFAKAGVPPPPDYQALKKGVLQRGVSPAAWKWLCRQPVSVVRKLMALGWNAETVYWVNLLSRAFPDRAAPLWCLEAGRPYLFAEHYVLLQGWYADSKERETLNLERAFRLVPASGTPEHVQQFEALASALVVSMQNPKWAVTIQPGMRWRSVFERLRRMSAARMAEAIANAEKSDQPTEFHEWAPLIGQYQHQGVVANELVTTKELGLEGGVMSHCVGDGAYLKDCLTGTQAIFSLEEPHSGARATLQLRFSKSVRLWLIGQLAGIGNSAVPRMFWNAARALQQQMPV